ncbi:AIPR family protein [Actinopolymorpha sp. B9G3]|uniref:AIPR family protein n=1 Tax=Actinopolymorpha sp. B9G3 TaxID=3158970 RepID=UPI0032D9325E
MNPIQLRHVRKNLLDDFGELIDLSDMTRRGERDREQMLLSRALAAQTVRHLAGLDPGAAVSAVIDGYDDQGIDAIAVSEESSRMWLVQAKWSDAGTAGLSLDSAVKFAQGVDLVARGSFERFNAKVQAMADRISGALEDFQIRITLVIALFGEERLSKPVQEALDDLLEKLNADQEMFDLQVLSRSDFVHMVRSATTPKIDVDLTLESWGRLADPYDSYFGTASVIDIAAWFAGHGGRLFGQNIRGGLGGTQVNLTITQTLTETPDHFWYFNNGITVLCDSVKRSARNAGTVGGPVQLRLHGASVVNGAQTVTSIERSLRTAPGKVGAGKVWVRVISLEDCPPGFASDVTRATNTQNRVEPQDYAALDSEQERLREEFAIELSKHYVIKRGETPPEADNGCTVAEAAVALACAHRDPVMTTRIKQDRDRLWERETYSSLFGPRLSAQRVWQVVLLRREVRKALYSLQSRHEGRAEQILAQGDLLVSHLVAQQIQPDFRLDSENHDAEIESLSNLVEATADWLLHHVDAQFGTSSYPIPMFKNAERCRMLAEKVLADIGEGHPVPALPPSYRPLPDDGGLRKATAVSVLVDARRIPDGTMLEFRGQTANERRNLGPWLAADPRRGRATWANHRLQPLLWEADGRRYAPSTLVKKMLEDAPGRAPKAVQGTSRWFVVGEGSLVELADSVRRSQDA